MAASSTSIFGHLTQFKTRFNAGGGWFASSADEAPVRSELFSADQMEQYGRTLAAAHKLVQGGARDPLLARLAANETTLLEVCDLLTASVSANRRVTPAGEWLLDNFHLIEEQIATAKRHLPRGYSRELPRLASGASAGLPRVYDIALATIAHGDGLVDAQRLSRFVAAYQAVTALQLGELWAIPIMLRLALIENLRRVGVRMAAALADCDLANVWADQMMAMAESDPKSLILVIADMARSSPPMGSAFVAELTRRLQGQSASLALALTWIEQQLGESHQTIEQLVQQEAQIQASHQVSISNSIGSLRALGAFDWREFVEQMSVVEKLLREDPAGVHEKMEFATRDRYRHATEQIARRSGSSEAEVAAKAIALARAGAAECAREAAKAGEVGESGAAGEPAEVDPRVAHVGYFLIDRGRPQLERAVGVKRSPFDALRRIGRGAPLATYLAAIAALSVALTAGIVASAFGADSGADVSGAMLAFAIVLSLLASSQFAMVLVNWLATVLATPHALARMDYTHGIAPQSRTLVVVPTMLTDTGSVERLIDALEVRFLANRDPHLHFALLTDFPDAAAETLPTDAPLLALAQARIEALNNAYRRGERASEPLVERARDASEPAGGDPFYLLHRPRRWNARQGTWMGEERKRGKIGDLNALLRGNRRDGFSLIVGATEVLSQVRYVITLDTDTQLPRDSARQMVGAMAHPLNRPRFGRSRRDPSRRIVTAGYGILQPRVETSLPGTRRSLYAQLHGGETGLDPYTRTVSDVYQDVFGEGSFIGKGIYDVDAFERALADRFPDNRILSHDLLEGCYARSGLLSDVLLYEEFPARHSADAARRHRWIRGDWQLAGWLRRHVPARPTHDGRRVRNPLSMLSQWKLADNLRRSLVPGALLGLLLAGWTVLPNPALWTAAVVAVLLLPAAVAGLSDLARKPDDAPLGQHVLAVARSARMQFAQVPLALAWLPYEAFCALDAIVRTLWRVLISRRRLLEWKASSEVERALETSEDADLAATLRAMWAAPAIAVATWGTLSALDGAALPLATPILLLWFVSPVIAWWISLPLAPRSARLSLEQTRFLRILARRTWAYFEAHAGQEENWLPPDNVQEKSGVVIAHRTSPTNMGLALLADLTAYDFGYVSAGRLLARTDRTLRTMQTLERFRGHFFNWYDTRTRATLLPRYVSTVDSGNLAGHLMTLRAGLTALADAPIVNPRWLEGVHDTFEALRETAGRDAPDAVARFAAALARVSGEPAASLTGASAQITLLAARAADIADQYVVRVQEPRARAPLGGDGVDGGVSDRAVEAVGWSQALARHCTDLRDELTLLAPWLSQPGAGRTIPGEAGAGSSGAAAFGAAHVPSLRELATEATGEAARARIALIEQLVQQVGALSTADYEFLYDPVRRQFVIGYNVGDARADTGYYDLLASEARFATFVAIAQGHAPQESWFALGRLLATAGGEPLLLSWSGSMFEYLLPLLVMPTYENTLLDRTCVAAVRRQIEYGADRGVPWGVSECGYNAVDAHDNYQYRAFGVPGLGLKRGLADDLVIAPYASALALMVAPVESCLNLQRLAAGGLYGRFGMYEAIDYTPSRQRRGESATIVRSFMAHHHGMSLLAFSGAVLGKPMQRRFESDPLVAATLLLLQERIPRAMPLYSTARIAPELGITGESSEAPVRVLATPHTPVPEVQLLSNGRYHVMVTNAGGGSSRWKDFAVTRWREDATRDNWGAFCYLRDTASGEFWSTAHQPTLRTAEHYEAIFTEGRAEFRRRDLDIETHTEIVVSPEDDIELRRVRIANRGWTRRTIEITSYAEVVLAPAAADALHPAFSNLFVQTEIVAPRRAILCTRRPRSRSEQTPWLFHLMSVHGDAAGTISFETDRMHFIGRGGSAARPQALLERGVLSGTSGSVLDPIVAIRQRVALDAGASATIDIVSGVGDTREAVLQLIEKYQDRRLADRVFDLTWTHGHVVLRQLNATEADAQLYGRLASAVLYPNASMRGAAAVLMRNRRGQSGLWGYAISGDLPIVLLQISKAASIDLVRQMVQAHAYWRLKGLAVDLVIWNEDHDVYRQQLQEQILGLIAAGVEAHFVERPGGIFVRHAEQISNEDRVLFESVARVIVADARGTLAEQIGRREPFAVRVPRLTPTRLYRPQQPPAPRRDELVLSNGIGGFTRDGREYVIAPPAGQMTPAPWVNVLANPHFGTVVSESGDAYTWCENAHLYRLTPWHNDPVCGSGGEALYIRDEETGHVWSPASAEVQGRAHEGAQASANTLTRHGFGYSVFERSEHEIASKLTLFVALDAAVKFCVLRLTNRSREPRRLSVTGYVEWVLGDLRAKSAMHVTTEIDARNGALYARNPYNTEFADWIAFFDVDDPARTVTGDRTEFIGRNGTLRSPAALRRTRLSGRVGAALDPCAAMQVSLELAEGEEREVVFRLGAADSPAAANALVQRFRGAAVARDALDAVVRHWRHTLDAVQVETPDPALNALTNGWLVYQTMACRLWARSGYYQSGGAFGFRDQLQDVMALVHTEPKQVRAHIVLAASRQFLEGDVQHWWHPPAGRGARTHCSDDYLWLPLATCRYVLATGDDSILDEPARFLEGRPVNAEDDSYYDLPRRSDESADLYQHCVRAIAYGLKFGAHGLPLMGSGDWNDGMNLVGMRGQGESVWLAFFLCHVLRQFAPIARRRGDEAFATRCESEAALLARRIEDNAWDGAWYRRAYFDDGTPLGSAANAECRIDSISQSWAVLSGVGDAQRSRLAMDAVYAQLVRRGHALIQLLDPPFDKTDLDPGYIRGYVPGVRENGGQYTHAAIWTAMAFAALGDSARAWELTSMINPVNHALTREAAARYKVEPYVVAADVYAVAPHTGRGGWTWYTGSAGWMYRLIVESLLGLRREADRLYVAPCVPAEWPGFTVRYRYGETTYAIAVRRMDADSGATRIRVDGLAQRDDFITLADDRREHAVEVFIEAERAAALHL